MPSLKGLKTGLHDLSVGTTTDENVFKQADATLTRENLKAASGKM